MAAYPSLPTEWFETKTHHKLEVDEAANGAVRTRILSDRPRREFPLVHSALTSAQAATWQAFIDANIAAEIDYTHPADPGTTYTTLIIALSLPRPVRGGRFHASCTLREK